MVGIFGLDYYYTGISVIFCFHLPVGGRVEADLSDVLCGPSVVRTYFNETITECTSRFANISIPDYVHKTAGYLRFCPFP